MCVFYIRAVCLHAHRPFFVIAILLFLPAPDALLLGLSNLKGFHTLWVDKLFVRSVKMSFSYSLATVTLQVALGTLAAAVVHRCRFATGTMAWLLFIPYAVPSVVAVVAWKFLILDQAVFPKFWNHYLEFPRKCGWVIGFFGLS